MIIMWADVSVVKVRAVAMMVGRWIMLAVDLILYCSFGSDRVAFVMCGSSRPARGIGDAVKRVVDDIDTRKDDRRKDRRLRQRKW